MFTHSSSIYTCSSVASAKRTAAAMLSRQKLKMRSRSCADLTAVVARRTDKLTDSVYKTISPLSSGGPMLIGGEGRAGRTSVESLESGYATCTPVASLSDYDSDTLSHSACGSSLVPSPRHFHSYKSSNQSLAHCHNTTPSHRHSWQCRKRDSVVHWKAKV